MGVGDIEKAIGRSVYNALQMSYKQDISHPFGGVSSMNLIVTYTLSRFVGNGGNDQNFSALAWDNNNPTAFMGPTSLNRTHAFKLGTTFDIAHRGPRISIIGKLRFTASGCDGVGDCGWQCLSGKRERFSAQTLRVTAR